MAEVDPNAVQADAPAAIATQGANVDTTLQTPTAAAPTQPMQLAAPAPPPPVATSKNPALHNLIGSVLGGLAGHPPPRYSYDDNGKLLVTAAPPQSSADKIRTIASNALTGLSAAGTRPQGKSGLASALTGAGVGFEAVQEKAKGDDILKRAQAKENFEQEQQAKLRQHEIARQNALTLSTYYGAKKAANDMDPHFAQNQSLFEAVKASPELGAHATEMSDTQVEQEAAKDPTFATTHIIKPLGWAPETDPATGQQVEVNGEPKFYMRMAVVNGTKDGKITVTPEMAADAKMYGPMARIPNAGDIKAGDTYDLGQLLPMMNKIDEQRKSVLDGWQKSELGWVADPKNPGKEIPVETNKMMPPDMAGRTRPLGVKPLAMEAEEGKTALEKAQAAEARGKAAEALANAAMTSSLLNGAGGTNQAAIPAYLDAVSKLPQYAQTILKNVKSPIEQANLLKLANGDEDLNKVFPTRVTKGSGQLDAQHASGLAVILNSKWTEGLFANKQKALVSFSDGEDGKAIASFGQFLVHANRLRESSENFPRTSSAWLQQPINEIRSKGLGQPGVAELMTNIRQTRSEWQTFINNGHATDLADSDLGRAIMSDASSPAIILGAAREMGHGAIGRLDQLDAKWRRTWGGHYPGIISDSARQGAIGLGLGDAIKQYPAESGAFGGVQAPDGSSQSGQPQQLNKPTPSTHIFDVQAFKKANPTVDIEAAKQAAKNLNYEIKEQ